MRRYILSLALSLIPAGALAHAHLDRSMPGSGATVTPPPKEVLLWFTEAVEPKFSSIVIRDAKGAAVQDGSTSGVAGNTAQLRVSVKPLPPGTYKVMWKVLSVDTHRSQGEFTFKVGP